MQTEVLVKMDLKAKFLALSCLWKQVMSRPRIMFKSKRKERFLRCKKKYIHCFDLDQELFNPQGKENYASKFSSNTLYDRYELVSFNSYSSDRKENSIHSPLSEQNYLFAPENENRGSRNTCSYGDPLKLTPARRSKDIADENNNKLTAQ